MSKPLTLKGAIPAIVTPFASDGSLDRESLRAHVRRQLEGGVGGLVPCGTTGESVTLDAGEREEVIRITVEEVAGRVPVIAGTGSNDTRRTVEETKRARELGADAALVVTPYYNKPTPDGIERHYKKVADEGGLPVVVYTVPGRTGTNIPPDVLARLWAHPGIVAVKEASGNIEQVQTILRDRPEGFGVLSGDDSLTLAMMALGAEGVISVAANEIPVEMAGLTAAALRGDMAQARQIHYRYLGLMSANFLESNPIPVKTALSLMGFEPEVKAVFRLPLCPARPATVTRLSEILGGLGLLPKKKER